MTFTTINHSFSPSFAPTAGWLSKMISLPFGRSRWISRFFVLLDSELRYYKDEHSETPSHVLNLRQICQIFPASTSQHPFCFRLEPKQQEDQSTRPWVIECKSETDMENWMAAIQCRIVKYSPTSSPTFNPSTSKQMNRATSIVSSLSGNSTLVAPPEVYRMPTLPLRCTNMTWGEEKESLLSRRNKKLAPIVTQQQQQQQQQLSQNNSLSALSSSSSSSSMIPSPTGAVLGGPVLISPSIIDKYNPSTIATKKQCDSISLESSSPTYLMYKKRFHL